MTTAATQPLSDPQSFRLRLFINRHPAFVHYLPLNRLEYAVRVVRAQFLRLETHDRYVLVADRGNLNIILWRKP